MKQREKIARLSSIDVLDEAHSFNDLTEDDLETDIEMD